MPGDPKTWKIAGIDFDHQHMGDLLRAARGNPRVEIVGVSDETPDRALGVMEKLSIPSSHLYADYRVCLEKTKPDIVILCPATARHGEWTEKVAPYGVHVLMEKPFAATLAEADRMIAAVRGTGRQLAINWPLRWYPPHVTTKRLIDEGAIGELEQVHYYDGNHGPMSHLGAPRAGSGPGPDGPAVDRPADRRIRTWFYRAAEGGGSLLDYLGYGTTLATWFFSGRAPESICCTVDRQPELEVDEHSVTVARYACGLSTFQTRWGTLTDPWVAQPQPKCGFVVVGRRGTISSYDYEKTVRLQTPDRPEGRDLPVDTLAAPCRNPIEYLVDCLDRGVDVEGPLSPAMARIGQRMVDAAVRSAREERTVPLPD